MTSVHRLIKTIAVEYKYEHKYKIYTECSDILGPHFTFHMDMSFFLRFGWFMISIRCKHYMSYHTSRYLGYCTYCSALIVLEFVFLLLLLLLTYAKYTLLTQPVGQAHSQ